MNETNLKDMEIKRLLSIDPFEGIKMLIEEYGTAVKTICNCFLKDFPNEDIEETISDVFTEFWKNIDKYDYKRANIKYYIYGIARNCAKNKRKHLMKKINCLSIDNIEIPSKELMECEVLNKINAEIILDAINNLKPPADKIFKYHYYDNYKNSEIADLMCISVKKIENILYHYKFVLRKMFKKRGIYYD